MSYQRKVIYISLGALLGVTVLVFLVELLDGGRVDGLGIGLVSLSFSVFEAVLLLLAAVGIALFGKDGTTETIKAPQDVLDGKESYERVLSKSQKARAFCAAAGLVLLLGGSLCFGSLGLGSGLNIH